MKQPERGLDAALTALHTSTVAQSRASQSRASVSQLIEQMCLLTPHNASLHSASL